MSPSSAPRSATAGRIADSLIEIAVLRGMDAVSVRSVADRAEVSIGAVQHHFPTKRHMLSAAMERVSELVHLEYERILAECDDPLDALMAILTGALADTERARGLAIMWVQFSMLACHDEDARAWVERTTERTIAAVSELATAKYPHLDRMRERVQTLLGLVGGFTVQSASRWNPPGTPVVDLLKHAIHALLVEPATKGLKAQA
ncbi:TetR/AcrR family transcriptional regulator [Devriesea agamarum]|uniref:TetR/AcrR family transcriptional regulator n=1 Tax=Devriesea agamarum TaxID=472569 RepID=UPI00071CFA5E|nr:TetR/AcrR family transcriptional regulator [Devriesea agamarum]